VRQRQCNAPSAIIWCVTRSLAHPTIAIFGFLSLAHYLIIGMENIRSRMLIGAEIVQSMGQSGDIGKICQEITTKLLDLDRVGHISIYKLDKFIDQPDGIEICGKIVADAIAANCEPLSQEQIENLLKEEYQWGQDITRQIIGLYSAGISRCEINLAEIFAGKAYLLVPIVLSERGCPLWGFVIVQQYVDLSDRDLRGEWELDDSLLLQQVAMQIELVLQQEDQIQSCSSSLYSSEQYRSLIENIPSISYVSPISNTLEFEYMSPQLRELLGVPILEWSIESFYSWAKHLYPDDHDLVQQALRKTIETGTDFCCEYRMITHNQRIIWVQDNAQIGLAIDGGTKVLHGSILDISDRKLAEAIKLAEDSNQAKTEFLSVMSHELRTPMNAVIGMTEILQRTALSRQQQQYVATIAQGGELLLSVINNILDFSRIESGHFELEAQPFRLQKCIEEVLELMAPRTAEKFIDLIPIVSLDVPQVLLGDYIRLRQILVNLVGNAIKFTASGEIVIAVTSQLSDRETNTYELRFEVRDTGVGIASDAIAKLFKAFSQADSSIARQYGGTGLGLAICKQLCQLMGGEIGVSSTVGEGSTFSFSVQMQAIAENVDQTMAIAPELKGKKILSVNSNSSAQHAIALYAQPWEMTIQAAYRKTDALQLLTTSNFDAVIIDRQLVEADGSEIDVLELARSIQEIAPDLTLILLTPINVVLNENTNSSYFRDCITKPISISKLYQAFLNVFTDQEAVTFSRQNSQLIPQPLCTIGNILDDENFAKCYPFRILVVEDNPVNQKILLLMLENLGYQADAVDNGQKAIDNFLSQSYDLIFMDIQMPIMNGLNATKSIRQTSNHQPWIIGLSADAFSESRDSALNAGMDDYLTKPLQIKSLIAALQKVPQQQHLFVDHSQPPIDLSTLASLEDSVNKENLDGLINVYLEHSASTIAKMKEAFTKRDFVAVEAENHILRGGSGTFGAIQLCSSCQALQSICSKLIKSNQHTDEDIAKIANLLENIDEQYNVTTQAGDLGRKGFQETLV
jgi:signal transduction histidine kinase/DNA-binding response OmpR family regulator